MKFVTKIYIYISKQATTVHSVIMWQFKLVTYIYMYLSTQKARPGVWDWELKNVILFMYLSTQEARVQRSQQRWDGVHSRLQQEEAENQTQGERVRNAKINRIHHYQQLEEEGQQRKDVRIKVSDQHLALLRSQVLPWEGVSVETRSPWFLMIIKTFR